MSAVNPVFIVGCIRSGTTILHKMLSAYCPQAVDIDEADFECRTFWQQRGCAIGTPKTGTRCEASNGSGLSEAMRHEITGHFKRRAERGRHIINKNPHLSNKIGLIHRLFPQARFVHIVREIPSVVASTKLHFEAVFSGRNYWGVPFLHYWPDGHEYPCWWALPASGDGTCREGLRRRLGKLLRRERSTPPAYHEPPDEFRHGHLDETRYYPGDGFRRIPESWLRINAGIIRQVDELGIGSLWFQVNYAELVLQTKDTLDRIARFCEIEVTAPDAVPETLDRSRGHKWRESLGSIEQRDIAEVVEELGEETMMIRDRLPDPLLLG